jgi:hypothetical protein
MQLTEARAICVVRSSFVVRPEQAAEELQLTVPALLQGDD